MKIVEVAVNYGKRTELYECESESRVMGLVKALLRNDKVAGFEIIK